MRLQKALNEDGQEVELHCHSEGRQAKETAMVARFGKLFEEGLQKISEGLQKPRSEKRAHQLLERIGRLKHKSPASLTCCARLPCCTGWHNQRQFIIYY